MIVTENNVSLGKHYYIFHDFIKWGFVRRDITGVKLMDLMFLTVLHIYITCM